MSKFLSIEDFIGQVEEEVERFRRYKTPFTIVAFHITFVNKDLHSNFLHKVIIELRNHLDKITRKTDTLFRHRNSLLVILKNVSIEQSKGFIDRIFSSIDEYAKKSYKESASSVNVTLVDAIIRVFLVSFSDLFSNPDENIIIFKEFDRKDFTVLVDNLDKYSEFETWELRLPIIDRI